MAIRKWAYLRDEGGTKYLHSKLTTNDPAADHPAVDDLLAAVGVYSAAFLANVVEITAAAPEPGEGWRYDNPGWTDVVTDPAIGMDGIKAHRDILLRVTDEIPIGDPSPAMSAPIVESWKTLRQGLRDVPQTFPAATRLSDVTWPAAPAPAGIPHRYPY